MILLDIAITVQPLKKRNDFLQSSRNRECAKVKSVSLPIQNPEASLDFNLKNEFNR